MQQCVYFHDHTLSLFAGIAQPRVPSGVMPARHREGEGEGEAAICPAAETGRGDAAERRLPLRRCLGGRGSGKAGGMGIDVRVPSAPPRTAGASRARRSGAGSAPRSGSARSGGSLGRVLPGRVVSTRANLCLRACLVLSLGAYWYSEKTRRSAPGVAVKEETPSR